MHLIGHCSPLVVNNIIHGLAAKYTCSNVFIGGSTVEQQRTVDIGSASYLNNVTIIVNRTDSSVIAYTKGSTIRKAIYRPGLGATLISDYAERQIRSQRFNLPSPPNINQDYIPWPMGDKIVDHSYPSNVNRTALENAIDSLFIETNPKLPIRTHAVVVVYDGKIIGEKYASGFSKKSKILGMSMTKSITGTLMGILVQQKGLNIDEPAPVPEWNNINDSRHFITIRNLLQQTSGLNWNEPYSEHSDVLRMLFMTGDMGHYTASLPLKDKPGSQFVYSSGNTNILSRIIRHQLDWIDQSIASSDGYGGGRYGFQFYLNKPANKNTTNRRFPNVPTDTYYAVGAQGQDVFIIPSEKLVVARLGATTAADYEWGADEFLQAVINSIE
ncbi:unnamed protein product [Adineta steineri]|uniref:Beta-lactamase-related domain-containing protein n=1 Tax=Adineta steineri TaxID=433720 RepID=A0A815ERM2_9BILA|nr:unnamed protein product [Adineta steineri]CAF1318976.1 unnamed protein product [Adineta steineri]